MTEEVENEVQVIQKRRPEATSISNLLPPVVRDSAYNEIIIEGLRKAGFPES